MSLVIELEGNGRKAGHVCSRDYRNGPSCPLIVRQTSEDVLTANVFGVLRRLRPVLWLRPMLQSAFPRHRVHASAMQTVDVHFWAPTAPPLARTIPEGETEVDVLVRFDSTALFIEAKFLSELATGTTHDRRRDQLARLVDVAYATCREAQMFPEMPFVLVLGLTEKEPELVTRYRRPEALREMLSGEPTAAARLMAPRLGYVSWGVLRQILLAQLALAFPMERGFLGDVAAYIGHRADLGSRIQRERARSGNRGGATSACEGAQIVDVEAE